MNTNMSKVLITWSAVLTSLFLITLVVAVTGVQAANDPTVEFYTATMDHAVGGAGASTGSAIIDSAVSNTILRVPVSFARQKHNHACAITASANVINPATNGNTGHRYSFNIYVDGVADTWSTMVLELSDNAAHDDANYVPVTTSVFWFGLGPEAHTVTFRGRKLSAGNPDLTIGNAVMTVLCFRQNGSTAALPDSIGKENTPDILNDK